MKRYADEDLSAEVRDATMLIISALAEVEVAAALWRKQRMGELDAQDVHVLLADFAADQAEGALVGVPVVAPMLSRAARLTGTHGLRAYDAVQLATAMEVRAADPACTEFWCFDRDLSDAATAEGFAAITEA